MAQQHHESAFEVEICEYLAAHGWLYSPTDAGYDRELALFPEDVFGWLADTQPDQLAKRVKPDLTGEALAKAQRGVLATLVKALGADPKANGGTLSVLRRGFKDLNAQFQMCQFRPNTSLNETTKKRHEVVRLRVMRQVHYSTQNANSIDLVFFVNGIPVATAELKTDLSVQNVTDAVLQYKHHRLPKGEPLLGFGSRTLVHFAVSNSEVQMTTKLAGKDTLFLPFNRGNKHHAGNPPNPHGSPTAYLWQQILQRDTWLDILGRFLHLQVTDKVDPVSDKKIRTQTMLFPRFHQWEAVTRLVEAARAQGPGQRYLIQHSAGSGKTNSISWLAHRLSVLHDEASTPVFDSVIVITDRNILDTQLQEAIRQIDRTPGVVAHIAGLGGAKSQELADALTGGTKIIIVTIQTFPFALDLIQSQADLKGKSFAVIADEAHSSQAGEASKRLKAALTPTELGDLDDGGTVDAEDKTFLTPDEAAKALVEASRQPGLQPLLDIFGADSKDLFPTGEDAETLRQAFVQAAIQKVDIDTDQTNLGRAIIEVGESGWPFPVPLIPKNGKWQFDVDEGRHEIAARRLGANEFAAIIACAGYVEAQQEYASIDRNNDGVLEYAQRILSTPGQKDGLYWDGPDSPIAGLITKSIADGFQPGKLQAYKGYYFRTLKSQGPDAEGGAINYVVKNKWMIGGYALLAWPAQYGVSGVRTFIVNHSGVIYEKDLGISTATAAAAIKSFNPDKSWRIVFDRGERRLNASG